MKRKFLSFILCLCLIGSIFGLAACKKDTGYKLGNLYDDYVAIASNHSCVVFNKENNCLEFDYSKFENTLGVKYFENALSKENLPFKNLNEFNKIYYNSMSFVNSNIKDISSNAFSVKRGLRDDIKTRLNDFDTALKKVNLQTTNFAQSISANEEDFTNELYLITFKHLLDSYDELYDVCYKFSLTFSQIYYSIEGNTDDIDYYSKGLNNFTEADIATNISHLGNRSKLSISFLSYEYYENYIQNEKMSTLLTTKTGAGFPSMGQEYETYSSNVRQISYEISHTDPSTVDKAAFFNDLVELYNIRECLKNGFNLYYKAINSIDYKNIKGHFNQTEYEKSCLRVIENYYYLQGQNFKALRDIYSLI